jgi:hypothetical protein
MSNYYFGFRPAANGKVVMMPKASLTITTGDLTVTAGNEIITAGNLTLTAGNLLLTSTSAKIQFGAVAGIIYAATDPSASSGTAAIKGSICLCGDGKLYTKYGTAATEWVAMPTS